MTKKKERDYLVVTLNEINDMPKCEGLHVLATDPDQAVAFYVEMMGLKIQPDEFLDVHVLDVDSLEPTHRLETVLKITST